MSPRPDPLAAALDALAGRGPRDAADPSMLAYGERLREAARRLEASSPCPPAFLRRVEALFAARAPGVASRVLALLFDSWAEPRPATRGAPASRILRYGTEDTTVDVEVQRRPGGFTVRVALEGPEAFTVGIGTTGSSRVKKVALDARGRGAVDLPADASSAVVVLKRGRREAYRSPPLPLA